MDKQKRAIKTANAVCSAAFSAINAVCPNINNDPNRIVGIEIHPDRMVVRYADGITDEKPPTLAQSETDGAE